MARYDERPAPEPGRGVQRPVARSRTFGWKRVNEGEPGDCSYSFTQINEKSRRLLQGRPRGIAVTFCRIQLAHAGSEEFWDFYWETRLHEIEDREKGSHPAVSRLVREMASQPGSRCACRAGLRGRPGHRRAVRGACPGARHARSWGSIIPAGRSRPAARLPGYPPWRATSRSVFVAGLGQFEIVMLVNACTSVLGLLFGRAGGGRCPGAKGRVRQALAIAAERLARWNPVLFDGWKQPGIPRQRCASASAIGKPTAASKSSPRVPPVPGRLPGNRQPTGCGSFEARLYPTSRSQSSWRSACGRPNVRKLPVL